MQNLNTKIDYSYIVLYQDEILDERTGRPINAWFQSPKFLDLTRAEQFLKIVKLNPDYYAENRMRWYEEIDKTYSAYIIKAGVDLNNGRIISINQADRFKTNA